MRAPLVLLQDAGLVTLVQAGRTISLAKPAAGTPDALQIAPGETLDLSQIANETIALVKLGNRLVVLFSDRAYVVVDGLYLPDGSFTPNVKVALGGSTVVDTAQFTTQFAVSADEQILTAAGISVGPRGAGGVNFAAAPQSSALNPESSLTADDSGQSSTFGALTPNATATNTDTTTAANNNAGIASAPTANSDTASVTEAGVTAGNTPFAGNATATGNLLTNDTATTNLTLTGVAAGTAAVAVGNVGTTVTGVYGTLTAAADGTYTYTLNNSGGDTQALAQGATGTDVFTYTVTDANGQSSTTTISVNVTGTNDAPVISSGTAAAAGAVVEAGFNLAGTATAAGTLTATDVDTGATQTWSGNASGAFGAFSINSATGAWTYNLSGSASDSLAQGETRTETFNATVTDQFGATATQAVTITITGTNDAPVVTSGAAAAAGSVVEAGFNVAGTVTATGTLTASDVDNGSALAWSGSANGTFGTFAVNATTGGWTYALNNATANSLAQGETRTETFNTTVTDQFGASATQAVTVTINGTNDGPVVTSGAAAASGSVTETGTGFEGGTPGVATATGTLTASDVDNGSVLSWSGNAVGTYGNFVINPTTGTWTYTIDEAKAEPLVTGETKTETFNAVVTDQFGATSTQVVTVTVNGANDQGGQVVRFDLDTGAAGTNYVGVTQQETAASQTVTGDLITTGGVSIGQTDESSALDPRPNAIAVSLANPATTITSITVHVDAAATGETGVLRTSAGFNTVSHGATPTVTDGTSTIEIVYGAGYTQAEAVQVLSTIRYVNTDHTFQADMSDRIVHVTLTDQNGQTYTADARIPVSGDVSDTPGTDSVFVGGSHDDRIFGIDGDDRLSGGDGNDYIEAGVGDDTLDGGNGNDTLIAGEGDNKIFGGEGDNTITSGSGDDFIRAGSGNDNINAGNGTNDINAGDGNNTVTTGTGDDRITTGSGDDIINAGDGANTIFSGGGNDTITTGAGDDKIDAGAGNDRITAGRGDDDITTGTGSDTIVFNSDLSQIGFDTLRDFQSGTDVLEFSTGAVAGSGLSAGTLDSSRFVSGTSFTDSDQRFRFDATTNTLYYDADGNGGVSQTIALAKVESGNVVAADIHIA